MTTAAATQTPAGFAKRFFAYGYDSLIVTVLGSVILGLLSGTASAQEVAPPELVMQVELLVQQGLLPPGTTAYNLVPTLLTQIGQLFSLANLAPFFILSAAYNIAFACGGWQATPGKRFCGIYIANADGSRMNLLQSTARHILTGPSMLLLGIPYLTICFTRDKLAPHDMLCRTGVWRGKL